MAELKIRNWERFQHYKDRNPPWIKLHYDLLSSRDWVTLDDAGKLLAIVCMLLGSRHDGFVPNDPEFIQRVSYLEEKVNLQPLIDCGFLLADASDCLQSVANDTTEERRGEERRTSVPFSDFWELYPRKTSRQKAEIAWNKLSVKNQKLAMEKLPDHIQVWDDPKYIPHPSTWLNQKRWEDDLETVRKPVSNLSKEISARAKQLKVSVAVIKKFFEEKGYIPTSHEELDG